MLFVCLCVLMLVLFWGKCLLCLLVLFCFILFGGFVNCFGFCVVLLIGVVFVFVVCYLKEFVLFVLCFVVVLFVWVDIVVVVCMLFGDIQLCYVILLLFCIVGKIIECWVWFGDMVKVGQVVVLFDLFDVEKNVVSVQV